jgi:hypothetical protein
MGPAAKSSDPFATAESVAEERNRKPRPRKLEFGHSGATGESSPLAGEDGGARSATPGERERLAPTVHLEGRLALRAEKGYVGAEGGPP